MGSRRTDEYQVSGIQCFAKCEFRSRRNLWCQVPRDTTDNSSTQKMSHPDMCRANIIKVRRWWWRNIGVMRKSINFLWLDDEWPRIGLFECCSVERWCERNAIRVVGCASLSVRYFPRVLKGILSNLATLIHTLSGGLVWIRTKTTPVCLR